MKIDYKRGIRISDGDKEVLLDPSYQSDIGVVTHGHLDHLVKDARMTPHTLDILKIRLGERRGKPVPYFIPQKVGGFDIQLLPAGHVFGSAMVKVGDILYTGDFNTRGGVTCGKAEPVDCGTLIIETTYGKREYRLPPKEEVEKDIRSWTQIQREQGPVVFGAYDFGKAQEIIALLNAMGEVPHVPDKIAKLCEVYQKHGIGLKFKRGTPQGDFTGVVSPSSLKRPIDGLAKLAREKDGSTAYLSGWCAFYHFFRSMDLDAQFPFSDHAGYDELIDFVKRCDPDKVLTVHGSSKEFAEAVEQDIGVRSRSLK